MKASLDREFHPDGYNVGFNVDEAAGQTVMHFHLHVIPRYRGDVADPVSGLFSAGLNAALIKQSPTEVVVHITECEWARYFRERHPTVGYVLACSTDDADLRATTDKLWLQRTSTLMEGGRVCDFRVYEG